MTRPTLLLTTLLALAALPAHGQDVDRVSPALLAEVMPEAERFDAAEGDPPVRRAYRGEELIGYVFLTSDLPPEEKGYSAPIESLVGVDTDGVLTGVRVTGYRESYRYEMGDFLSTPWFLEQFVGKQAADRFAVGSDIDGMSRVTISVRALARGVRDDARRIVVAYGEPPEGGATALSESDAVGLSWYEMLRRGIAGAVTVRQERRNPFEVSLLHLPGDELGEHLLGRRYPALLEDIEEAGGADDVFLYAVGGAGFAPPLRAGWSVEQDGRTVALPRERVVRLGTTAGALADEASQVGALLLDEADGFDVSAPLTFAFDRGRPEAGISRVSYTSPFVSRLVAEAPPTSEPPADAPPEPPADAAPAPAVESPPSPPPDVATDATAATAAPEPGPPPTATARPAAQPAVPASDAPAISPTWTSLTWTLLVIALACLAFFTKQRALRWTSIVATTVLLGWVDGGFLSISHVTGLIWVGVSAIRSDPALTVLALFTVASLLLWGRVFCGFLCPFGTLQDLIDRVVPRRLKRELPASLHRTAWKAKYGILALILGAALIGWEVSLYQYFEPFGTVFSIGRNALLWAIAAAFLATSAVIPRFYCRYACPLGALLALGSVLSLRRIPRVEQCDHCHVCEQRCPTGAITGPKIDFHECVRCNVCEVQLIEQRGVCRHDMEKIRPRLVQLRDARRDRTTVAVATTTATR